MKITLPKIVRRVPNQQPVKKKVPTGQSIKKRTFSQKPAKKKQTWISFVVLGLMLAGIVSWIIEQVNDPLSASYLKLISFTYVVNVNRVAIAIAIIGAILAAFRRFNWLPLLLPLISYIISIQNRQTPLIYLTFWVLASVLICEYYFPKYLEAFFGIGLVFLLFFKAWIGAAIIVLAYLWNKFYVFNNK